MHSYINHTCDIIEKKIMQSFYIISQDYQLMYHNLELLSFLAKYM